MNEDKKSFIVYCDWIEFLDELDSYEKKGRVFEAILIYGNTGIEPVWTEDELDMKFTFIHMRQQMDRDSKKWNGIRAKRSAAGKKGGEKSAQVRAEKKKPLQNNTENVSVFKQIKQSQANQAVNVNVNVNDNVNVNVNDNVIQLADDLLRPLEKAVGTSYERERNAIEQLIAQRLDEGHTEEELRKVVDYQCKELKHVDDNNRDFRELMSNPTNLFGNAFEQTLETINKPKEVEAVNE